MSMMLLTYTLLYLLGGILTLLFDQKVLKGETLTDGEIFSTMILWPLYLIIIGGGPFVTLIGKLIRKVCKI